MHTYHSKKIECWRLSDLGRIESVKTMETLAIWENWPVADLLCAVICFIICSL